MLSLYSKPKDASRPSCLYRMSYHISKFGKKLGSFGIALGLPSGNPSEYSFLPSVTFKESVQKVRENRVSMQKLQTLFKAFVQKKYVSRTRIRMGYYAYQIDIGSFKQSPNSFFLVVPSRYCDFGRNQVSQQISGRNISDPF